MGSSRPLWMSTDFRDVPGWNKDGCWDSYRPLWMSTDLMNGARVEQIPVSNSKQLVTQYSITTSPPCTISVASHVNNLWGTPHVQWSMLTIPLEEIVFVATGVWYMTLRASNTSVTWLDMTLHVSNTRVSCDLIWFYMHQTLVCHMMLCVSNTSVSHDLIRMLKSALSPPVLDPVCTWCFDHNHSTAVFLPFCLSVVLLTDWLSTVCYLY